MDYIEDGDGKPKYMPITEDILKKNDFTYNGLAYINYFFDIEKAFSDKNEWNCGKFSFIGKGNPDFHTFCTIQYVHELQHVFKLFNINTKLIL